MKVEKEFYLREEGNHHEGGEETEKDDGMCESKVHDVHASRCLTETQ